MKRFWFLWLWLCVIGACAQQDGVDKVLFNGKIVTLDGDSSIVRAIAIDGDRIVSLGTDTPVVPYPPLWVLFHFITRDTISAGVMGEAQKITRDEALRAMGPANAELSFEEHDKGTLEVGKLADLVVLSDDILTCEPERIRDMDIVLTMVGGEIVYEQ